MTLDEIIIELKEYRENLSPKDRVYTYARIDIEVLNILTGETTMLDFGYDTYPNLSQMTTVTNPGTNGSSTKVLTHRKK